MQLIQRSSCPDRQRSSAVFLASMIDERTRDYGDSSASSEKNLNRLGTSMQRPDASVLIWVESDAELLPEPTAGRHRGMIVVAHASGQGPAKGSFIISYPVDTDDDVPHVTAVSNVLERMGWAVLDTRRGSTAGRYVNIAALVSNGEPGSGQYLWLAETVGATEDTGASTRASAPGSSAAPAGIDVCTQGIRDQLQPWVNEGGAGDDVAS